MTDRSLNALFGMDRQGRDWAVIVQCLRACADGPFFPESEFQTLFGLTRPEFRELAAEVVAGAAVIDAQDAVVNALNHLLGYPHDQDAAWPLWVSASPDEVSHVLQRCLGSMSANPQLKTLEAS